MLLRIDTLDLKQWKKTMNDLMNSLHFSNSTSQNQESHDCIEYATK